MPIVIPRAGEFRMADLSAAHSRIRDWTVIKTQKNFSRSRLSAGVAPVVLGLAMLASPAFAQAAAEEEVAADEIIVTGSLISNPNLERSSPVNVTSSDEIELRQTNNAEQILREIPGIVPSIGSAVNNGNGGASFVNLRGLGSNRNVVIIDGNRLVPAELNGRFDLNNVPVALVEQVEVLTGGASTTYGADAISGVVNFITKQDFAGVEIAASNGITEEGDGNKVRVDVTLGANFDDGRGNAVFSIGYQQADPVYQGARDISVNNIDSYSGGSGGSGTTAPARFSIPGTGTRQIDPATGNFRTTSAFNAFNFNPYNIFQTPYERYNMYGAAHYEISDAVEVYTRGLFSKNSVSTVIAPSGAFGLTVVIPYSNPYLAAGARNTMCTANGLTTAQCNAAATATSATDPNYRTFTTVMSRRATELGPRISEFQTTYFDYRLGFRGAVTDKINWDVSGAYGQSENVQTQSGYWLNSRVRQSLLATNATTCLTDTNGCVPLNIFGADGSITPAMNAYLSANSLVTTKTDLAQAHVQVSGDSGFTMPWAADGVSFAIGGEYRKYGASQESDLLSQSGDLGGAGGAAPNINGGYEVYEAIGEVIVPIVQDKPFFDSLTLEAGIRYSSYKVDAPTAPSYKTTTYKVGGSWEPGAGLKFRGNYAHSVRAPNIAELFSPVNTGLTNLADDPCANLDDNGVAIPGRATPTGVLRDVCIAQGAPSSVIGLIAVPTAGQANATGGGNIDLQPETSNSYTFGVVYQPDYAPGLSLSVDYYNISVSGAVSSPTPGDAMNACFGAGNLSATNPACLIIRRSTLTGSLSGDSAEVPGLFLSLSNLGALKTDGIDATLNYKRDVGFADLSFALNANYTFSSTFNANVLGLAENRDNIDNGYRECVGYMSANCGSLQPKFQLSARTTLTVSDIDVSLLWRHISGINQEPADVTDSGAAYAGAVAAAGGGNYNLGKIKAYDYFDLSTRLPIGDNVTITLNVANLLNKKPPLVGSTIGSTSYNSGNTYPSTYDALGRSYSASVRFKF